MLTGSWLQTWQSDSPYAAITPLALGAATMKKPPGNPDGAAVGHCLGRWVVALKPPSNNYYSREEFESEEVEYEFVAALD